MSGQSFASKEPRYIKVARELIRAVIDGHYPVGTLLPHEAALCEQFGVSRTTVREALRHLSDQGIVEKRHGVGTVVRTSAPQNNYVVFVNYTELMQYGQATSLEMLDRELIKIDAERASRFGCGEGEYWFRIRGLRSNHDDTGQPISLLQVFIPERFSSVANEEMHGNLPYHLRIKERYQVPILGVEQEIRAVAITDPEHVVRLGVEMHSPGLYVLRRFYGLNRELLQVTINTHPADRFAYTFFLNHVRN